MRNSGLSDEPLGSGDELIAACFECDAHEKSRDYAKRYADCQRSHQVYTHLWDRRINQK